MKSDAENRKEKVESVQFNQAQRLIFMWVKQNVIGLKEFKQLCEANRMAV